MADDTTTDLDAARAHERAIAERAAKLRGETAKLTPALFDKLYPLLLEPIPPAYIVQTPQVTGKPYESTGIRSVQVQIDRMNAVFTPRWWRIETAYEEGGKLARCRVHVGNFGDEPALAGVESMGGVDRGSTVGNVYKGSFTNAAKRAFAALGVGHEVYLGDADLDPDVNADVATAEPTSKPAVIGTTRAKALVDRAWAAPAAKAKLQLAATHAANREVGDCSTKAKATKALAGLSNAAAERLEAWIGQKEAKS